MNVQRELKEYYEQDGLKQHEEGHSLKAPIKASRILTLAHFSLSDVIVDIGCAKGEVLAGLISYASCGIGIDLSLTALQKAVKDEKIHYLCADVNNIPLADEMATKIIAVDLLEHVPNPKQAVLEMKRVLSTKGEMVIEVPYQGILAKWLTGDFHEGHLRYYSPGKIAEEITSCGLVVQSMRCYNSVPLSTALLKIERILMHIKVTTLVSGLIRYIPWRLYPWFGSIMVVTSKAKLNPNGR